MSEKIVKTAVKIIWEDSAAQAGWVNLSNSELPTSLTVLTFGILVAETPQDYVVSHSLAADNFSGDMLAIPKKAVISFESLGDVRKFGSLHSPKP